MELIILASGSELSVALEAATQLGNSVRVVSMPCMERFDRQDAGYRESVLPKGFRHRMAVEAGVSDLWRKYVGLEGVVVGIDRFGLSAPGDTVLRNLVSRSRMWSNKPLSPACGSDQSINSLISITLSS